MNIWPSLKLILVTKDLHEKMEKNQQTFTAKKILTGPIYTFVLNFEKNTRNFLTQLTLILTEAKVIYSATSLVKQKEPQILIQTVLKNWLYFK